MNVELVIPTDDMARTSYSQKNNESLWRYAIPDIPMPATLENEIALYHSSIGRKDFVLRAVLADGVYVGCVRAKEKNLGSMEIGYYIFDERYYGKGIATNAVSKFLDELFTSYGIDIACAYINNMNEPSLKVALNNGFYPCGISFKKKDIYRFEITKTIWQTRRK